MNLFRHRFFSRAKAGLIAAVLLASAGCLNAPRVAIRPGYDFSKLGFIAVLNFEDASDEPGSGELASEALEPYLMKAGYRLVGRGALGTAAEEEALDPPDNASAENLTQLAKTLGVSALVVGRVSHYSPDQSQTYVETVSAVTYEPAYVSRRGVTHYNVVSTEEDVPVVQTSPALLNFSAQLIDGSTGEILWAGSSQSYGVTIGDAAGDAAQNMVNALKAAWPARPQ